MKIIIPGDPIPQQRPRLYRRYGKSGAWDPNGKQKDQIKRYVQQWMAARYPSYMPLTSCRLSFVWHMPIPKSVTKRDIPKYQSGLHRHTSKPDVDNLAKLYMDCLTGIIYADDNCASLGFAVKLYHLEPKTIILINQTSECWCRLNWIRWPGALCSGQNPVDCRLVKW